MIVRFQFTQQIEFDTETGKSRVLKQWSNILGKGNTLNKPKQKEVELETDWEEKSI